MRRVFCSGRQRACRGGRIALALLVVLGAIAAFAGVAGASSSVVLGAFASNAFTGMFTDGHRFAAFEPVEGTTRVIDATGEEGGDRPDPAGCVGGLVAVGAGELLYSCASLGCTVAALTGGPGAVDFPCPLVLQRPGYSS